MIVSTGLRLSLAFAGVWFFIGTGRAWGVPIRDLFNTGVTSDGSGLLPVGQPDPHYTVSGPQASVTAPQATVQTPHPAWSANGPNSMWIGVTADGQTPVAPGTYLYETTFDLPSGADPKSVVLTFGVAVDNLLNDIVLNGSTTRLHFNGLDFGWNLAPLQIDRTNGHFAVGTNALIFNTFNNDSAGGNGPHGFRVGNALASFNWLQVGDLNHDGSCNFQDLLILAQNYRKTNATLEMGDITGDGLVGFDDLLMLSQHYGQTATGPQTGAATEVPEPFWPPLACFAVVLLGGWRSPRKSTARSEVARATRGL